ncbi:hypothetical protein [Azospirillum canadense]|uniref:hypothetical protein n=1 Tax=Azospirillum canadense TaxID=403962 RepID=UPI002226587C|nr:hypothetical protein [Azospirillum canadense]MCW2243170.1 hypothetical protein [Azospirillum canadense]
MRAAWKLVIGVALAGGAIFGYNALTLNAPVQSRLAGDARNRGVEVWTYHRYGLVPSQIVFDLRNVSDNNSPLDVTRTLLQAASALKDRSYDTVYLAWRGQARYVLDGGYFRTLGREFGDQNPIYTLRTLPENVRHLNGSQAFGTWTGGWLGVTNAQMSDLQRFHEGWFLRDLTGGVR